MTQPHDPKAGWSASTTRVRRELEDDAVLRERFESCQGLVRSLAWKIHQRLPKQIDLEDLIQYGQQGLLEAAMKFDPTREIKFVTFAHHRIRGAILDGVSKLSWFRWDAYHDSRYSQLADDVLEVDAEDAATGKSPSLEDEARWLSRTTGSLGVIYFASCEGEGGGPAASAIEDAVAPSPDASVIDDEIRERLHELLRALPADAGELMRAVYFEGLSIKEAGERLGISKAWASRLHARTLRRLERALRLLGIADL